MLKEVIPEDSLTMDEPLQEDKVSSHNVSATGRAADEFDPSQTLDTAFRVFLDLSTLTTFFDPLLDQVTRMRISVQKRSPCATSPRSSYHPRQRTQISLTRLGDSELESTMKYQLKPAPAMQA